MPSIPPRSFPRPRPLAQRDQRAAPLVRVQVKCTVTFAGCDGLPSLHTVILTVILTLTRPSVAALSVRQLTTPLPNRLIREKHHGNNLLPRSEHSRTGKSSHEIRFASPTTLDRANATGSSVVKLDPIFWTNRWMIRSAVCA